MALHLSLRNIWIIICVSAVLLSFAAALSIVEFHFYEFALKQSLQLEKQKNDHLNTHIATNFQRLRTVIKSKNDTINFWLSQNPNQSQEKIKALFEGIQQQESSVYSIRLLSLKAENIIALSHNNQDLLTPKVTIKDPELVISGFGREYIGSPKQYHNLMGFTLAMPIGKPVKAIVLALIDSNKLWPNSLNNGHSSYILDRRGSLVTEMSQAETIEPGELMTYLPIVRTALMNRDWATEEEYTGIHGQPVFGAYSQVKQLGWVLISEVNSSFIKEEIFKSIKHTFYTALMIMIPLIISVYFLVKKSITPIKSLGTAINRVTAGDYSIELKESGVEELDDISLAFKKMAKARMQAEKDLQQLNFFLEQRIADEIDENQKKEMLLMQQSRLATMGEMIGNIAHQWRQPLNALSIVLMNIADALEFGDSDQAYLDKQIQNGESLIQNMSTTIDDFRNFFKSDLTAENFNPAAQVREALKILSAVLDNHKIQLSVEMTEELHCYSSAGQYKQVILNLIGNAKNILVEKNISASQISINLYQQDNMAMLAIQDNGGGVPEDILEKIFDPYFTTRAQGTGLGLYMSKLIVENNMHGQLDCKNKNGGALFTVKIPLSDARSPKN